MVTFFMTSDEKSISGVRTALASRGPWRARGELGVPGGSGRFLMMIAIFLSVSACFIVSRVMSSSRNVRAPLSQARLSAVLASSLIFKACR